MTAPVARRNSYSLEADLQPIIDGTLALPNFKPLDLEHAVGSIAASYGPGVRGNVRLPDSAHRCWAQIFLDSGQGGGLEGSGVVLYYNYTGKGAAARFAICEHIKVEGPNANHSRGWHPGHCSKCGLDLSVDSGD